MKNNRQNIESWHAIYPNSKREKKNENHRKYNFYKLLDDLIELGYENRITIHSSVGIDLLIKGQNNNLLILRLNLENKLFELEINKDNNTFFIKEIEIEKVKKEIVEFVEKYC